LGLVVVRRYVLADEQIAPEALGRDRCGLQPALEPDLLQMPAVLSRTPDAAAR
jgi:hypothetical protein